jgi:hypothetical protein
MRRFFAFIVLLGFAAAPLMAQTSSDLPALPRVPDAKPPAMEVLDDSAQPQVTISIRDGDVVEEHRINGKLYRVTVTPAHGVPYTLVDQSGDGSFVPMETQGSPQLSVPMWVIGTF